MNILIATPYLPYPSVPHGGGHDLFQLIRFLAARHRVSVASFVDDAQAGLAAALRPHVARLTLVRPAITLRQKAARAAGALREGTWRSLGRRADAELRAAVRAAQPDVLYCAWTEMGRYLAEAPADAVRVLDEVDVRFIVDAAAGQSNPARKLRELTYCRAADLVVTRSARDLAALRLEIPALAGLVVPPAGHADDFAAIRPDESRANRVLFVGALNRRRNQQAVHWLVDAIWPLVRGECPEAVLRVVGAQPPDAVRAHARRPGVEVAGWVNDLRAEYAQARVVVAPMQSEAGALNKVIDGLAAGRAVVATTRANAGVAAPPETIRLADSAPAFARAVVDLLRDDRAWRCTAEAGRRYALQAFDWPAAAARLEAALVELHGCNGSRRSS